MGCSGWVVLPVVSVGVVDVHHSGIDVGLVSHLLGLEARVCLAVTETSDVTNIWAEHITVTADIGGIFGGRPTTNGTPPLREVAWMVDSHNFLVSCHVGGV